MKLIKEIEIVVMNGGGWNAAVPGGPWATDKTPAKALARLLAHITKNREEYRLAVDNREEQPPACLETTA